MLEVLRLPYILTARAKGLTERRGHLAPRVAERAVSGADALRPLAADPGHRLGVRRVGLRLARTRLAGRRRGREPGLSPAHGDLRCSSRRGRRWAAFSPTSPTPCSTRESATRDDAEDGALRRGLAHASRPGGPGILHVRSRLLTLAGTTRSCPTRSRSPIRHRGAADLPAERRASVRHRSAEPRRAGPGGERRRGSRSRSPRSRSPCRSRSAPRSGWSRATGAAPWTRC